MSLRSSKIATTGDEFNLEDIAPEFGVGFEAKPYLEHSPVETRYSKDCFTYSLSPLTALSAVGHRRALTCACAIICNMYYVYLLQNSGGKTYIGYTNNLKRRLAQHNSSQSTYTRNQSWRLAYYEAYASKADAERREKCLKQRGQGVRQLKDRVSESLRTS